MKEEDVVFAERLKDHSIAMIHVIAWQYTVLKEHSPPIKINPL